MTRAERFMAEAIALSLQNVREGQGGPFAALVVHGEEVIARGANRVVADGDPTAHAEIVAIRDACRRLGHFQLTGCEVYASCEPCPMCLAALYWARPLRLCYAATREDAAAAGFDDSRIYDEISQPIELRVLPMTRLMRDEARAAFEEWTRSPNKIRY